MAGSTIGPSLLDRCATARLASTLALPAAGFQSVFIGAICGSNCFRVLPVAPRRRAPVRMRDAHACVGRVRPARPSTGGALSQRALPSVTIRAVPWLLFLAFSSVNLI